MRMRDQVQKACDEGKVLKWFILFLVWRVTPPTPAMGFVLGALVGAVSWTVFRFFAIAIAVAFAALWQVLYYHYWEVRR